MQRTARRSGFFVVALCIGVGCRGPGVLLPTSQAPQATAPRRGSPDPDYRVAAGDVLEVRGSGVRTSKAEVLPDGYMKVGKLDPVRVDNLTPSEVAAALSDRLGDEYRDCSVTVAKFNSQFIYVFGDSRQESPRAIPYQGRETLPDFLARVGCRNCWRGYRARVVRPSQKMGDPPEIVAVKLDGRLQSRAGDSDPVVLKPNDYVYMERDGSGPGDIVPRGSRSWPWSKLPFGRKEE